MATAGSTSPAVGGSYRFEPATGRAGGRRSTEFWRAMRHALRVAQGLGVGFALAWGTGPAGSVELAPEGRAGRRWVERIVAPCYLPGEWVRSNGPGPWAALPVHRLGTLEVAGSLPDLPEEEEPAWSDLVFRTLRDLPPGCAAVWEARPGPPPRSSGPRPPPLEGLAVPAGSRLAPLTDAERRVRDLLERRRRAVWHLTVRVHASRSDGDGARRLGALIRAGSQSVDGAALEWHRPIPWVRSHPRSFPVSEEEVVGLFPAPGCPTGFLARGPPLPGLPIGRSAAREVVTVPTPPAEGRHLVLLGETGMGKSSALIGLALAAARRSTTLLFDPIGDTARRFLELLPTVADARVRWISPVDSPLSVNALDALRPGSSPPLAREKARLDLVAALRRVRAFRYADSPFWGPRIEETLGRALAAAAEFPGGTLVDAAALLDSGGGRSVSGLPAAAQRAIEELRATARSRPEEVDGTRRLLAEVATNEVLRALLCDPKATLRPAELVREGGITVVSGDAPAAGEGTARYLVAVLLALVWSELLARPGGPKTFVVLDEAQWYAHDAVAEILRLGRRSNVHLYLATQALGSLLPPVRDALVANAADYLLFRGAPDDAREFSRWRSDLTPSDLLALGRGEALFLRGKGHDLFRLATAELPPAGANGGRLRRPPSAPHSPIDATPGPSAAEPGPAFGPDPPTVEELLAAALDAAGDAETVQFPLDRVRALIDPGGLGVRALGRRLERSGALRERRTSPDGPVWVLHCATAASLAPAPPDPARRERAQAAWNALGTGRSASGQPF